MSSRNDYTVTYLIVAHKYPRQLRRLVEKLSSPESNFWIQIDSHTDITPFLKELAGLPQVNFVTQRVHPRWGHYNFVRSFLLGIEEIHSQGHSYDHLVFLSGQDYPLVSTATLIDFLSSHRDQSFVHFTPMQEEEHAHLWDRIAKYHLYLPNNKAIIYPYEKSGFSKQILNKALHLTGKFPLPRVLPHQMKPYFGSNWVRLQPKAVAYLLAFVQRTPEIETFFKYTLLSDEHFFQTILLNATDAERGKITNTNFTFSHWKRPAELYSTPLNKSDWENLLASGDLLARKFDESSDPEILDWLDRYTN